MFSENWNCLLVIFNKANCVNSPLKRRFPFRALRRCFNSCCTKWWLYIVPPPPPFPPPPPLQYSVYLVSKAAVCFSSFVSSLSLSRVRKWRLVPRGGLRRRCRLLRVAGHRTGCPLSPEKNPELKSSMLTCSSNHTRHHVTEMLL